MGFEILAGPVNTEDMAADFEHAGASAVLVMPKVVPRFDPDAVVDLLTAQAIRNRLETAKLCLLLDGSQDSARIRESIDRLRPEYIAFDSRYSTAAGLAPILQSVEAEVVLIGPALDYDEDPGWVEDRIQELASEWSPAAIVLTLLPGLKNPVHWLRSESGSCDRDVLISDIEKLLTRFSLVVNIDISESDVDWAREHFAAAAGVGVFVGKPRDDGGSPVISEPGRATALITRVVRTTRS